MKAQQLVGLAGFLSIVLLISLVLGDEWPALKALALAYIPMADPNAGWEEVGIGSASGGGISDNSGNSYRPSVSIAPDGTPYVAWEDDASGDYEIYVRRWNGSVWEEVGSVSASGGGISNNNTWSGYPSLAIAPDGTPYVAWANGTSENSENDEIYVRRWNGLSWEEVGTGSASGGGISKNSGDSWVPRLAIAPDDTPYVAWEDWSTSDVEIYVRRWNGNWWEEVGAAAASGEGISNNNTWSGYPSLAIAPDGAPYVAWADAVGWDNEIYIRHWNGSIWTEVGAGSASGGGISNNNGDSTRPSVAIGPNGIPYIAWDDASGGNNEIYVRRWNGFSWEEVGTGSASGGGISNNNGDSLSPWAAVAPYDNAYVAWQDDSDGNAEIYVRRWNESWWEEVGYGSASGGGISNNSGDSYEPSLAIGPGGKVYVAWHDVSDGDAEIYVRRYSGDMVFLPLMLRRGTPLTNLLVRNLTSGILYVYRVTKGSTVVALCENIPSGDTQECDSFPTGCYDVYVDTAECGSGAGIVCFPGGDVTREVRCQ
jgi:hypothetical protein